MSKNIHIPGKEITRDFFEKVASNDPADRKKAQDIATDFTRVTVRDEGILRNIIKPEAITLADCSPQLDSDEPVKYVNKEVSQPLSVTVGFGTLPKNQIIRGDKYRVDFARTMSRSYTNDRIRLGTYDYDIRNVFKENIISDHLTIEDVTFFNQCADIVTPLNLPTNGTWESNKAAMASPVTGRNQYYDFTHASRNPLGVSTGFTVEALVEATKILSRGFTPGGAPLGANETPIRQNLDLIVMNRNTAADYQKLPHTSVGDLSEELFRNGLVHKNILGVKHLITLKDDVVKDGEAWYFPKQEYLGKFYELEQPTMFIEERAFMVEFFLYACIGASIGNPYGIGYAKFY